jgi:hypothetical protein
MECNNGIVIPQLIEDPCNGKTTKASCVIDPTVYPEYSLSENSSQQQINQATYLSIQNLSNSASPTPVDGSETKVTAGLGVTVIGDGTEAAPYVVNAPPAIDKTYSELTTMVTNNELIPGQTYLLTDYMTTYIQPVTDIYMESGVIEPLLLTAVLTNKFHTVCKSQLYPQDIVYYSINADIDSGAGTEGFTKGKIYRRIDTLRNNDIGTDWRHIKYNRSGVDRTFFLPASGYNNCFNNNIYANKLFNTVVGVNFNNNTIKNIGGNIGNTFGDYCSYNIIDEFYNNNVVSYFQFNKIADFSGNSVLGTMTYNTIGDDCTNNTINNNFRYNNISHSFKNNSIGDNFINNDIKYNFSNNIIGSFFRNNNIERGFSGKNIPGGISDDKCTVDGLPTMSATSFSQKLFVTDASSSIFGSTVVGGGSITTPVFWNGTNWIVG